MTSAQTPLVECVPNFSEGRDSRVVDRIEAAIRRISGVLLLGRESDFDHNRSVITFAGAPSAVLEAAVSAVGVAASLIDLSRHAGVHPRIGAADVVPFVPLEGASMEDCIDLAHRCGERIWSEFGVPAYYYEFAALRPERVKLEDVRRGGYAELLRVAGLDPARAPDVGGPALHPTAGASAVGARRILLACNINLQTENLDLAKGIARRIRASSGGFPHVKALGLALSSRGLAQVSMNLTHFEETPLSTVFDAVEEMAAREGVRIAGTEMIGFMPGRALEGAGKFLNLCENFTASKILENRISEVRALA